MKRRTKALAAMVKSANYFFLNSTNGEARERRILQSFVASQLHAGNSYTGFRYLNRAESIDGNDCGIIFDAVGLNHEYPDETRIAFL